ncbi:hypothetical protein BDZ94DRAFT_1221941 [Collybia nuda]|uniref:G domain-containing protein n=1 Tax=Collybia nuda TaxID=64659 RepID=A0A9P5Y1M9_9AGAR|nr:hypothetical protein BDZ94DRAFT_1221941 [Collybia nuda]
MHTRLQVGVIGGRHASTGRPSMKPLFGVFKLKHIVQQAQNILAQRQGLSGKDIIKDTDLVIAVIGAHGAGKSSIVSDLTGNDGAVQHNLQNFGDVGIKIVTFEGLERSDQRIVFIDTPGIDDTNKSEEEVLKKIEGFLPKKVRCTLAAILYLHKISENRVPTKYLTNIHRYKTLCGTEDLHKVHLVTTLWNEVEEPAGLQREMELKKGPWRAMIDHKASVYRYLCSAASAWAIVKTCIEMSNNHFDNRVGYDLADLGGKITEKGLLKDTGGDAQQLEALYGMRKAILKSIRAAVIRGEADDQWSNLRAQFDALHIQLCEVGDRLRKSPKLSSSFGPQLHHITSGPSSWGTK